MSEVRKSLVSKLAAVMGAVERIPKRGHNSHFNYDFATEADIVSAIRKELADRKVFLLPAVTSEARIEIGKTSSGSVKALTQVEMTFTFLDGESGETLERQWRGAGVDSEDKGLYKAMTGGEKYFLLKTFLVPTGDDPEVDEGAGGGRARRQQTAQRPQQSGPRPATSNPAPAAPAVRPAAAATQPAPASTTTRPTTAAAAAAPANRVPAKPSAAAPVQIVSTTPKSGRGKEWIEVTFSNGEMALATTPKVMHDVTVLHQKKANVVSSVKRNDKGANVIEAIAAEDENAAIDREIAAKEKAS